MNASPVAFLVQKMGPYHDARLRALAALLDRPLAALEFRTDDSVYPWDPVAQSGAYRRLRCRNSSLAASLEELQPGVLVCVGYADREINRAVAWGLGRGVPLVVCSDSTLEDAPRSPVKERLKRLVVTSFDAALVAGTRSDAYLASLGTPNGARFRPWDVVDNAYFERGANAARIDAERERARLGLPARYFLCVARFVAKKNLGRLLEAYGRYVSSAGARAWDLVLSGSGPLERELRADASARGLGPRIHFPGFLQYADLPAVYGLAGALVLPSLSDQWGLVVNEAMAAGLPVLVSARCGCAPDLVRPGVTGFTFDPENPVELADRMSELAQLGEAQRAELGRRGRALVAEFSPEAFARGLKSAIAHAIEHRRPGGGMMKMGLLRLLGGRAA